MEDENIKIYESVTHDVDSIYDCYEFPEEYPIDRETIRDTLYEIAINDDLNLIIWHLQDLFYNYLSEDSGFSREKYFDEAIDMILGIVDNMPSSPMNAKRLYNFLKSWTGNYFVVDKLIEGDMLKYLSEEEVAEIRALKAKND